jgi:hypothetical protein
MKVDQQSHWYIQQAQMREKLGLVNRVDRVLTLGFNHDSIFNYNVSTKPAFQFYGFVNERNGFLTLDL